MLKSLLFITVLLSAVNSFATVDNSEVLSPDGRFIVKSGIENRHGVCCGIEVLNSQTKQTLHTGYYNGYDDDVSYEELFWSPDNQYLAIIARTGKRFISLHILRLDETHVKEVWVGLSSLLANISGRRGEIYNGHETVVFSNFKWKEKDKLSFLLDGEIDRHQEDGSTRYSYKIEATVLYNYLEINEMTVNQPSD